MNGWTDTPRDTVFKKDYAISQANLEMLSKLVTRVESTQSKADGEHLVPIDQLASRDDGISLDSPGSGSDRVQWPTVEGETVEES